MIEPNMATMLSFVLTDADIDEDCLDGVFRESADRSFNAISVDGCMSTNDTALILANGVAGNSSIDTSSNGLTAFRDALFDVMESLARDMVRDGEGATKLIEIVVDTAKTVDDARKVAYAIARSNLVKTAFFGEDAAGAQKLVNSMKLDFAGVNGGDLTVSLLAADHSEAADIDGDVLGVWSIDGDAFDFGTGDVDLTIRYDDALAASLGLSEGDLKFYHFVGGNWVDVTTGVDTAGNLISADGVDSFSLFAVGNVPEPTTMGLLAVGAVAALAQRRTR